MALRSMRRLITGPPIRWWLKRLSTMIIHGIIITININNNWNSTRWWEDDVIISNQMAMLNESNHIGRVQSTLSMMMLMMVTLTMTLMWKMNHGIGNLFAPNRPFTIRQIVLVCIITIMAQSWQWWLLVWQVSKLSFHWLQPFPMTDRN